MVKTAECHFRSEWTDETQFPQFIQMVVKLNDSQAKCSLCTNSLPLEL